MKNLKGCFYVFLIFGIYLLLISSYNPLINFKETYWEDEVPTDVSFVYIIIISIIYWFIIYWIIKSRERTNER